MITRCPNCQSTFRISAEHLRPARGQVQCGICNEQFDALENLQDEAALVATVAEATPHDPVISPADDEPSAATAASTPPEMPGWALEALHEELDTEALLQIDSTTLEDADADLRFTTAPMTAKKQDTPPDADSVSKHGPITATGKPASFGPGSVGYRAAEDILLADLPHIEVDREEIEAIRSYLQDGIGETQHSSPWWGVTAAMLLVALTAQFAWYKRDVIFEKFPEARTYWTEMCAGKACALPAQRDLQSLRVLSRDVRDHPHYKDALLVNATVVNDASYAQPFPTVELALFDQGGELIGIRRFEPLEYLDDSIPVELGMKSGQSVYIVFELASLATQAISFEFKFL